ncbi:hypothetical protein ISCGN_027218 [Ixodes scapularis]
MLDPRLCASGHFALADCLLGDQLVRLISVYAPSRPGERKDFFVGLRALLDTPATLVVGGDFNCVTNSRDRVSGSAVPRADVGAAALRDAVRDFDLVDVTETLDKFSPRFTRWRGASQARLDRVYVSGEWSGSVVSYDAKIVPFSDHGFVAAEILAGGPGSVRARRDTPWKMNFSILESEDFIEETRRALQNLEEGGADAVSWEEFKIKLRDTACALGRRRGAEERQARIHLTNTLKALLEEEESSPGSFSDDIKLCKEHLLAMLEERYKGAQVRSRVETLEGETQPSKIFRTHERKRATENTIKELRQGARVFTSREDIAGVFETSFRELFREERLDDVAFEPFLRGSPSVPEGAVDILPCPIREAEVQHAIKHLSRNKAPGPDGIGSEFYKIFSDALCPILARVFNDIRRRRLLPPTMRQSFTVLIPKNSKKGPISEVGDFRPISLLCSDYKILAKILARRLDTGLKSIIGPHQTYGLRGRKISRNLHIMRAIGEATAEGHQPLAVLQLDLRQAFDRVSHRFLLAALDRFGVGEELREWIALCYRDISTRLLINGQRGGPISIGRSVRQGCPLSPMLFALQLEPLCRAVNADPSISGLRLGDEDVRVLAFADDVSFICSSKVQVQTILRHVDRFCAASGAMINRQKSAGAWLGEWATTPRTFGGIGWSTSLDGYLGVPVDPQRSMAAVWRPTANSVAAKLSPWRCRNLSFFSRAHVCNTVSYPAVLYRAQAVCCPGSQAGKVHRNWAMFVWKSAMESTRRNNLFLHQESGGLGLVNIVLKLHVQRFLLFRDAKDPTFIAVLHHLGFPHLGNWMVSTSGRTTKGAALRFYKEIASSIEFLQAQFSWEYLATVGKRRLYWDAVSASFPPPLYRQPPTPDDATRLYKLVRILPIPVATRDFFVRMHMEVLPVKTWLHQKGFFVPWSLNCDLCGAPETIQHVLVECSNAYLFWDEMRTTFELRDSFEVEWSVFKYLQLEERDKTEVAHMMMLLGLHAIWQSRTAMVQCHLDARPTWSYFVSTLGWVLSVTSRQPNAGDWECIERQLEEGRRRCVQRRTSGVRNWRVPVNCRRVGVG